MNKSILGAAGAVLAVALSVGAPDASAQSQSEGEANQLNDPRSAFINRNKRSFHADVERTERGHKLGNAEADTALIEFISYTCGHCAQFSREADGAIDLALLAPGHMSAEIRPIIRNYADLTVSLLAQCGPTDGFKARHQIFFATHDKWMAKLANAPQSQQQSWARADKAARISMASAMGFDDLMVSKGLTRTQITQCLSDDATAQKLVSNSNSDMKSFAVSGTPSFALNGELLDGVHTWGALYPVLSQQFVPEKQPN
ncbi:MAG: thioredoxin domain-containing protein [Pseudomonadota bacterium]